MIERQIIIGLITSTEYLRKIKDIWEYPFIQSSMAKRLSKWCWDYYNEFNKHPGKNIELIYYDQLAKGLPPEIAEEIEEDILPGLNKEFEDSGFDLEPLLKQTQVYFSQRNLEIFEAEITNLIEIGDIDQAEQKAAKYKPILYENEDIIDLSDVSILEEIDKAFTLSQNSIISFPGKLGEFWNHEFLRGKFISLLGPEKRGKTYRLLQIALQAAKQYKKVAFFQAGDMNKGDQLMRICIYLAGRSNKEKFCGKMYEPELDCIWNQTDYCDRGIRECNFGVFMKIPAEDIRKHITKDQLIKALKDYPDYKPCRNCLDFYKNENKWGTPWLNPINIENPLTSTEAKKEISKFFIRYGRSFKIATYPTYTLTIDKIEGVLNRWEKDFDFIPDVIIIDYADILTTEKNREGRDKENHIWMGLRKLSQTYRNNLLPLVVTATQSDARSYEKNRLGASNFSEDKRKLAHVTAMYGLNQDVNDREKELGIIRINEIGIREAGFSNKKEINILQNLNRGRPLLDSYF